MPNRTESDELLVLSREDSGENHLKLHLLGKESGLLLGLLRQPRSGKTPRHPPPDLFDCIDASFSRPKTGGSGPVFLSESTILRSHPGLARKYPNLEAAGTFARMLIRNAGHLEDHQRLYQLTLEFMGGLEQTAQPGAALLKGYFRFFREEGYPLKEDWWQSLPAELRERASYLLKTPLQDIRESRDAVEEVLESLLHWLRGHTDILL